MLRYPDGRREQIALSSKAKLLVTSLITFPYLGERPALIRAHLGFDGMKSTCSLTCLVSLSSRPWLDTSSPRVTQTSASNWSPTSPEGSSPTWIMTSRFRRRGFVHKRLYLSRRGTNFDRHSLFSWSVLPLKTSPFHKFGTILLASIP